MPLDLSDQMNVGDLPAPSVKTMKKEIAEELGVKTSVGERMFHEVKTLEQGRNYILEIVAQVELSRKQIDELHAQGLTGTPIPKRVLEKGYRLLSVRYGQALGALTTLMHCRVLNDVAYNELNERIQIAMLPKVVGEVSG